MKRENRIFLKGLLGAFYIAAILLGIVFLVAFINILNTTI